MSTFCSSLKTFGRRSECLYIGYYDRKLGKLTEQSVLRNAVLQIDFFNR